MSSSDPTQAHADSEARQQHGGPAAAQELGPSVGASPGAWEHWITSSPRMVTQRQRLAGPLAARTTAAQRLLDASLIQLSPQEVMAAISRDVRLAGTLRTFIDHAPIRLQTAFAMYLRSLPDEISVDSAVARDWSLVLGMPMFNVIEAPIRNALSPLATDELTKEKILGALQQHFEGYPGGLHAASRVPAFSKTLLDVIRRRQSKTWVNATNIAPVPVSNWTNDELRHWTLRHYTTKFTLTLGKQLKADLFEVAAIGPPPFMEVLSSVSVATLPGAGGGNGPGGWSEGNTLTMSFSGAASSSGHTTGIDWSNIGNVGDTFYGLFYKGEVATSRVPGFITDAVYFAEWSAEAFGEGWASSDWLSTAHDSRKEDGEVPKGEARSGSLPDIIASLFPAAATREFSATNGRETADSRQERHDAFSVPNFEVKKPGAMQVTSWNPVTPTIERIKSWRVNPSKGTFSKLAMLDALEKR